MADGDYYEPIGKVFFRHRNAEASADLIIPVQLVCNTPDEVLLDQVKINSNAGHPFVKVTPAHERVAIICGSGPSLLDHLDEIKAQVATGNVDVFALNGSARALMRNGIVPYAQVFIDARAETLSLLERDVPRHLFASQVHPVMFANAPNAQAFHVFCGDGMWDVTPDDEGVAVVGGTASVGNCSTCLAYALGYRDLRCYGYDSSHRGDVSHAVHQAINDGEPLVEVTHRGITYTCSFTMRSQADTFMRFADALEAGGAKVSLTGSGLLPAMWKVRHEPATVESERAKYKAIWECTSYHKRSPVDLAFDVVHESLGLPAGSSVIDFGCGGGEGAARLAEIGYRVTGVDIVDVRTCRELDFVCAPLWDLPPMSADGGICCDVMEHIPPAYVDASLGNIARSVKRCVFTIAFVPDEMGALIGERLHLSIHDEDWWTAKLQEHFNAVTYRGHGLFIAEH